MRSRARDRTSGHERTRVALRAPSSRSALSQEPLHFLAKIRSEQFASGCETRRTKRCLMNQLLFEIRASAIIYRLV